MTTRVNITDQVYAQLRDAIISGQLDAGSLHSVYKIAADFGVSRTPVREAVLRLADAGLVRVERNRGIRIRGVTIKDIRDVFELRLLLEIPATSYAATHGGERLVATLRRELATMHDAALADDEALFMRHDRAFHDAISAVLGNRRLSEGIAVLRDATLARGASTVHRSRGMAEIEREHVPIVEALSARDPVEAAARMEAHLVRTGTLLMRQLAHLSGQAMPSNWADRVLGQLRPSPDVTRP